MGGSSGPMLLFQPVATRPQGIGPEGPPTRASPRSDRPPHRSGAANGRQ
ncbi:DUF6053 domain-containing protein [Lysobacter enzymogenes]